jgi:hypothetical protein
MKRFNQPIELIAETTNVSSFRTYAELSRQLNSFGFEIESISPLFEPLQKNMAIEKTAGKIKIKIKTKFNDLEINSWDVAHMALNANSLGFSSVEPDMWNEYTTGSKVEGNFNNLSIKSFTKADSDDFDNDWPPKKNLVWHLNDNFSQLALARSAVAGSQYNVRIGHIDTGYTNHFAIPAKVREHPFQKNFIEGEDPKVAFDTGITGIGRQPYHGTGTLSILVGDKVTLKTTGGQFNDYLGAAYFADVIPCRIAKSVILFKTSAFAAAVNYLTQLTLSGTPVHVITMSMGGAPSKLWADAVNSAYDAGITMVTAAGNNFDDLPTRHVIYPARFNRVIAACGVTYDLKPYRICKINEMQGNYGPPHHMSGALAAFTPNVPWAKARTNSIEFSGAGTSAATPQIAAAAAIYYRKYHEELDALQPWQRVEAIRYALFNSALKIVKGDYCDYTTYFGNGILQANCALNYPVNKEREKSSEDKVPLFPILDTVFNAIPDIKQKSSLEMLNTELWQLVYYDSSLSDILYKEEVPYNLIGKLHWDMFATAVIESPSASQALKSYLKMKYYQ